MAKKFTFHRRLGAFTARSGALVYVPDQVIANPPHYTGTSFPVIKRDGTRTRATLQGAGTPARTRHPTAPVVALH